MNATSAAPVMTQVSESLAALRFAPSSVSAPLDAGQVCADWPAAALSLAVLPASAWWSSSPLDRAGVCHEGTGSSSALAAVYTVHCMLMPGAATNADALLADAEAKVLVLYSLLPLPADILTYRSQRRSLESALTGLLQPLPSAAAGSAPATSDAIASAVADWASSGLHAVAGAAAQAASGAGTVSGSTTIALLFNATSTVCASASSNASASPAVITIAATVGGVAAGVNYASSDGLQAHLITPPYEALCADTPPGQDCGYQRLSLSYRRTAANSDVAAAAAAAWLSRWLLEGPGLTEAAEAAFLATALSGSFLPLSAVVEAPPWWPGLLTSAPTPPFPVAPAAAGSTSARLRRLLASSTLPAYGVVPGTESASGVTLPAASGVRAGLYYTQQCAGYTDITSGACSNTSHPDFPLCAFGSGDGCRLCPAHALCPGGWRAVPAGPGWFTAAESSGVISACAAPGAERCAGWDASAGAVQCGAGYKPQSYGCAACDAGFYQASDGSCAACPAAVPATSAAAVLLPLAIFAGAALGCLGFIIALAFASAKVLGGTVDGAWARSVDLLVWIVIVLQLLGQMGQTAAPSLPPPVSALLRGLAIFQFQDAAVPAACVKGFPFAREVAIMVAVVVLQSCLLGFLAIKPLTSRANSKSSGVGCLQRWAPTLCQLLFTACGLAYALVCNTVFGLLGCHTQQLTSAAAASLEQDDAARAVFAAQMQAEANGGQQTLVSVLVLTSRPEFVCYSGAHRPAAAVAWVALLLFVVAFPLWSAAWARRRVQTIARELVKGAASDATPQKGSRSDPWQAADAAALAAFFSRRGRVVGYGLIALLGYERALSLRLRRSAVAHKPRILTSAGSSAEMAVVSNPAAEHAATRKRVDGGAAGISSAAFAPLPTNSTAVRQLSGGKRGQMVPAPVSDLSSTRVTDALSVVSEAKAAPPSTRRLPGGPPASGSSTPVPPSHTVNPLAAVSLALPGAPVTLAARAAPASAPAAVVAGLPSSAHLNRCAAVAADTALQPFVGNAYRASLFYTRQLGLAGVAGMACMQACWYAGGSASAIAGRCAAIVLLLLGLAWWTATRRPFPLHDGWKAAAQTGSLLVTSLGTTLTHQALIVGLQGPASPPPALTALAYITVTSTALLLCYLAVGFVRSVVTGARREARQIAAVAAEVAKAAHLASGPSHQAASGLRAYSRSVLAPAPAVRRATTLRLHDSEEDILGAAAQLRHGQFARKVLQREDEEADLPGVLRSSTKGVRPSTAVAPDKSGSDGLL